MGSFRVVSEGPLTRPLAGTVNVGGAKNSALKLMAAALLAPGRSVVHNVPDILDVAVMGQLLRQLGCTVDIGVRPEAQVGLRGLAHVPEAGLPTVTGARVDAGQVHHGSTLGSAARHACVPWRPPH